MLDEQPIDYEDFISRLNLPDDKIAGVLYDLYVYEVSEDKKDKEEIGEIGK